MARRKLEELNLIDDFLFGSVVTYPGIGEEFARILLRIIFQREFGRLKVVPQRVYYGSDTDKHGTRLDVYLEEFTEGILEDATIYDVEPETKRTTKAALPKRVRFYHAKIDSENLESGQSYHTLKNVIIIIITPFDPFGLNRMVYTIQNKCAEEPEMVYDDGAKTIFLYTKGTAGNPPEDLRQLLNYFEHTTEANASNRELKEIQSMVKAVKRDKEVSIGYMKIFEIEEMIRDEGRDEGRKEERENTKRERLRAEAAEAEVHRLRAELARLRGQ